MQQNTVTERTPLIMDMMEGVLVCKDSFHEIIEFNYLISGNKLFYSISKFHP